MKITQSNNNGELTVCLEGRLDALTAPDFEQAVLPALNGITSFTLDAEKLDYIASAGLRVLIMIHHQLPYGATMKVIHANELVREVFEVTGMNDMLGLA